MYSVVKKCYNHMLKERSKSQFLLEWFLKNNVVCRWCKSFCGDNLEELFNATGQELKSWFDLNKFTLNLNKTKYMVIGNRSTCIIKTNKINSEEIERVSENILV